MPSYCFETETLKGLFLRLSGSLPEETYSFEELIEKLSGFKRTATPEASSIENTIALLRESLILEDEHVAHCFSILPDTPKNATLREALTRYLHSEKSQDWTSAVWHTISELKEKRTQESFQNNWIFVKDPNSTFLFGEFAKAFIYAKGVELADIHTFGTCLGEQTHSLKKGEIFRTSSADALKALAEAIETTLQSSQKVLVPFYGSKEERVFLTLFLKSKGLDLFDSEPTNSPSFYSRLRLSHGFSLERRLSIWHEFKTQRCGSLASVQDVDILKLLKDKGSLTEEEWAAVSSLLLEDAAKPPDTRPRDAAVKLLPWVGIPTTDFPVLAFAGESLFEFDTENTELTNQELEMLYRAGFQLPRMSEVRKNRLAVLAELTEAGSLVFTSLAKDQLSSESSQELPCADRAIPRQPRKPDFSFVLPQQTYSATQLETYAVCPTKYLLGNRLKLRRDAIGIDALPLLNGQIVHRALELHFSCANPGELKESLLRRFDEAVKEIAPHLDPKHPLARNLRFKFFKIIPSVLRMEAELDTVFGTRKAYHCEKEFEISLNGKTFRGKIDRIDELSDGSLLILDYKTGTIDFTPEHIRKGFHFQALLYLLATETLFSQTVAGMLFYDLKNSELRRGILIEERVSKEAKKSVTRGHTMTFEKYRALTTAGTEQIQLLSAQIEKGNFLPTPSAEACSYCEFATFCRSAYAVV